MGVLPWLTQSGASHLATFKQAHSVHLLKQALFSVVFVAAFVAPCHAHDDPKVVHDGASLLSLLQEDIAHFNRPELKAIRVAGHARAAGRSTQATQATQAEEMDILNVTSDEMDQTSSHLPSIASAETATSAKCEHGRFVDLCPLNDLVDYMLHRFSDVFNVKKRGRGTSEVSLQKFATPVTRSSSHYPRAAWVILLVLSCFSLIAVMVLLVVVISSPGLPNPLLILFGALSLFLVQLSLCFCSDATPFITKDLLSPNTARMSQRCGMAWFFCTMFLRVYHHPRGQRLLKQLKDAHKPSSIGATVMVVISLALQLMPFLLSVALGGLLLWGDDYVSDSCGFTLDAIAPSCWLSFSLVLSTSSHRFLKRQGKPAELFLTECQWVVGVASCGSLVKLASMIHILSNPHKQDVRDLEVWYSEFRRTSLALETLFLLVVLAVSAQYARSRLWIMELVGLNAENSKLDISASDSPVFYPAFSLQGSSADDASSEDGVEDPVLELLDEADDAPQQLELDKPRPRDTALESRYAGIGFELDEQVLPLLQCYAETSRCSLQSVLLVVFHNVLRRFSRQTEIATWAATASNENEWNMVPVHEDFSETESLGTLALRFEARIKAMPDSKSELPAQLLGVHNVLKCAVLSVDHNLAMSAISPASAWNWIKKCTSWSTPSNRRCVELLQSLETIPGCDVQMGVHMSATRGLACQLWYRCELVSSRDAQSLVREFEFFLKTTLKNTDEPLDALNTTYTQPPPQVHGKLKPFALTTVTGQTLRALLATHQESIKTEAPAK